MRSACKLLHVARQARVLGIPYAMHNPRPWKQQADQTHPAKVRWQLVRQESIRSELRTHGPLIQVRTLAADLVQQC